MIETTVINWMLLLALGLLITGLACLLFSVCIMEFRKGLLPLLSALLIILAVVCYCFRLPSSLLIVSKMNKVDVQACPQFVNPLQLDVKQLKFDAKNRSFNAINRESNDNSAALVYDGYIATPFYQFTPGQYQANFYARGTRAAGEFAIIKVKFETIHPNRFLFPITEKIVVLTAESKQYTIDFAIPQNSIGRLKIFFVNDEIAFINGHKQDRNVRLKDIRLWKK